MKQFLTSLILLFSIASGSIAVAGSNVRSESGPDAADESVSAPIPAAEPVATDIQDTTASWLWSAVATIANLTDADNEAGAGNDHSMSEALQSYLTEGSQDLTTLLESATQMDLGEAVDSAIDVTSSLIEWSADQLSDSGMPVSTDAVEDPFEPYNRMMFRFNQRLDEVALKPLAEHYHEYTPELVRTGVRNFFSNIGDVGVLTNSALQGKFDQALSDSTRVAVNTIAGVGGVIDVATMLNIEKNHEDFGQTFGVWGIPEGPYIVLPVLGPRTLRSAVGTIADTALQVETLGAVGDMAMAPDLVSEMLALNLVDKRSQLLGQTELLEEIAIDPYVFSRQAYLAYRRCQVEDCDKIDYKPADPEVEQPGVQQNELDELLELDELSEPVESETLQELDELNELEELDALNLPEKQSEPVE